MRTNIGLSARRSVTFGLLGMVVLLAGGCRTRLWELGFIERPDVPDMTISIDLMLPETSCHQVRSNKVDLLFMIDNSFSMAASSLIICSFVLSASARK